MASTGSASTGSTSPTIASGASSTSTAASTGLGLVGLVHRHGVRGRDVGQRVDVGPGLERRQVGHRLDHRREPRRIALVAQAVEVLVHVGLEAVDLELHLFDPVVHRGRVRGQLALEQALAGRDAVVGLLADARDLGLGPVADPGDVVVGPLAQGRGAFGRALADRLGDLLGVGLDLLERLVAGRRRGRTDRSRQVRHQLRRLLGRRGGGGGGFDLDHALGLLGILGLGRSGIGRSGIWCGFFGRALPVGGDAQAGVDVGVRPLEVVGRGLGLRVGCRARRPRAPPRHARGRSSTGA